MIHSPCSDTALLHLADDRQQTREWLRSTSRRPNLVDMNLRPRRISPRPPIGGYRSAEEVRQRDSKIPQCRPLSVSIITAPGTPPLALPQPQCPTWPR